MHWKRLGPGIRPTVRMALEEIRRVIDPYGDFIFVDVSMAASKGGDDWLHAYKTITEGVNAARYTPGTTTIDTTKARKKYVIIAPGQYNEQVLFSGYNISLIAAVDSHLLGNKDYGVTINYDGAVDSDCVLGFTGAGIELDGLCIHCNEAIPAIWIPSPGDGSWIHNCYLTGDDAKTGTVGIDGDSVKTMVIEDNKIEGFTAGMDFGLGGGAWFYNTIVRRNLITKVTNGIYVNAGAVCGQSAIIDNDVVGSSSSIVNASATDIIIRGNHTKPAVSDGGSTAGGNTTLS